ncbi:MAG: hypothetical protein WC451_02525 [Patescibacteria group bacterium]|jgi:hypothetical protein
MTEYGKQPDSNNLNSRRREYFKLVNFRQYSWYIFALAIYLFCAGAGFLIAYFVLRMLVNFQVSK